VTLEAKDIARRFAGTLGRTLFLVGAALLFALALRGFITPDSIKALRAKVPYPLLVVYAEMIAFISPGPRYISYPILTELKAFGVDAVIIMVLLSGHVLIEPSTTLLETGLFGYRFPLKRIIISFIVLFLAALITKPLAQYFAWRMS